MDGEEDVPRGWSGRKESEESEESEEGWTVPFKKRTRKLLTRNFRFSTPLIPTRILI